MLKSDSKDFKPNNMLKRARLFITILKLNLGQKTELLAIIRNIVKNENLLQAKPTKHAPIINLEEMMNLANELWSAKTPNYSGSLKKRRMTALQIAICCFSGARWIDSCRVAWHKMEFKKFDHGTFVKFHLPFSKADPGNFDSKVLTIASVPESPKNCPVLLLKKYWLFMGKPSHGFVFSCQDTHIMGHITLYQMQTFAKKLGWKVIPTRHTMRVSFCVFLALNGVDRDKILQALNWKFDSHMIQRYVAHHTAQAPDSPTALIARELSKTLPFNILNPALTNYDSLNATHNLNSFCAKLHE